MAYLDAFAAQMTQITDPKILEHKTSSFRSSPIPPVPHHDPAKLTATIESSQLKHQGSAQSTNNQILLPSCTDIPASGRNSSTMAINNHRQQR